MSIFQGPSGGGGSSYSGGSGSLFSGVGGGSTRRRSSRRSSSSSSSSRRKGIELPDGTRVSSIPPEVLREVVRRQQEVDYGPLGGAIGGFLRTLDAPSYPIGRAITSDSPGEILPNALRGLRASVPEVTRFMPVGGQQLSRRLEDLIPVSEQDRVTPGMAIRQQGWANVLNIPGPVDDLAVTMAADILGNPLSYAEFATGSGAARRVMQGAASRARDRVIRDAALQQADDVVSVTLPQAVSGAARQSRAVRWNPRVGPDIIPGQGLARPAPSPLGSIPAAGRRTAQNIPYPVSARHEAAMRQLDDVMGVRPQPRVDPRTAANAGQAVGETRQRVIFGNARNRYGWGPQVSGPRMERARLAEQQAIGARNRVVAQRGTPQGEVLRMGARQQRAQDALTQANRDAFGQPVARGVGERPSWRSGWGERPAPAAPSGNVGNQRAAFTSKPEMAIAAQMEVTEAGERAAREVGPGISVGFAGRADRSTGATIPVGRSRTGRPPKNSLPSVGGAAPEAAVRPDLRGPLRRASQWWNERFVSQYGPNNIVADGARQADDWTVFGRGEAIDKVTDLMKTHKVKKADRVMAAHYWEAVDPSNPSARESFIQRFGMTPEQAPANVKAFAKDVDSYIQSLTNDYIAAGGNLKRLRKNYVYHAYNPTELQALEQRGVGLQQMIDKYGETPGFVQRRGHVSLADAAEAGLDPVEDLAEIAILRASAHHRSMADSGLVNVVRRKFGRRADVMPGELTPDGRMAAGSNWSRLGDWTGLSDDADILIPSDVAQTLMKAEQARTRLSGMGMKGLRTANRHYKFMALFSPGYHIRNQISDMLLVVESGGNPFSGAVRGAAMAGKGARQGRSLQRRMSDIVGSTGSGHVAMELGDEPMSAPRWFNRGQRGVPQAGGREVTAHSRARQAIFGNYRKFSTGRENLPRSGMFANRQQRVGAIQAGRDVKRNLYNYGDVGSWVDTARRYPIAPFLTWPVKNIPGQVRHMVQRPRNAIALSSAYNQADEQFDLPDPRFLPAWFRGRLPISTPWGYASFDNPAADLNNLYPANGRSTSQVFDAWTQQLGPPAQALSIMQGRNPLTGGELRERAPAGPADSLLARTPGIGNAIFGKDVVKTYGSKGESQISPSVRELPQWLLDTGAPVVGHFERAGLLDWAGPSTRDAQRPVIDPNSLTNSRGMSTLAGARVEDPRDLGEIEAAIRLRGYLKQQAEIKLASLKKARSASGKGVTADDPEVLEVIRLAQELKELNEMKERAGG